MSASEPRFEFQRRQSAFAAYIRDPDGTSAPEGIEPRRMGIYARLVYNNIEAFLARTFGTCRSLVDDDTWHAAVRAFVREHRAQSPYFSHIPAEFLAFVERAEEVRASLPPFSLELCHYEWTKLALDLAPDIPWEFDGNAIADTDLVALSPLARLLEYAFPVHAIDAQCADAKPTLLVAWRDRHDMVRAMRVNSATMRLLQSIGEGRPAGACLDDVAAAMPARRDTGAVRQAAASMLARLHRQDVVLRPADSGHDRAPGSAPARNRSLPLDSKRSKPLVSKHLDE